MNYKRYLPAVLACLFAVIFFLPPMFEGKILLPADTIVGLYHPYRDAYRKEYPNGVPFKNFLITDPVRQQFPWKMLAVSGLRTGQLPIWNPYTFSGTPLLANFQAGVFYPLNLIFLLTAFLPQTIGSVVSWNSYIILQALLGSLFMFLYLKNLRLTWWASMMGGFVFSFSGFSVAWFEWGNIGHTALWLPLILLAIDKLVIRKKQKELRTLKVKETVLWGAVLVFSLSSSFFAGHLQTFFYLSLVSLAYFLVRWVQRGKELKTLLLFALCSLLFVLITLPQSLPSLAFILASARSVDQMDWHQPGWFIPWQNSIQFLAPDFFGNPTTLNYSGVWNYAEFIGYIGIVPFFLSLAAIFSRRDKKTFFYVGVLLLSLLFAFPTVFAFLPFSLSVPFLSSSQPTRLLFLVDFALAILSALGLDYLIKQKKAIWLPLVVGAICFAIMWAIVLFFPVFLSLTPEQLLVSKRNLWLPTLLFMVTVGMFLIHFRLSDKRVRYFVISVLCLITVFDLFRFTGKFLPFTDPHYLYLETQTTTYLKEHAGVERIMSLDSRILPPNFTLQYGLQTVEGYDPLYFRRYGELIAASERNNPDIRPPFGFNRIITPHVLSPIINLLGVKYVLSLTELTTPGFTKVFQEGETRVYENSAALPRVFFVQRVIRVPESDKQSAIDFLFDSQTDLRTEAVVEVTDSGLRESYASGSAVIQSYYPNLVSIKTVSKGEGFLVLTDTYYPTWKAHIITDAKTIQEVPIYRTNFNFRGIVVPSGEHIIEFTNSLF